MHPTSYLSPRLPLLSKNKRICNYNMKVKEKNELFSTFNSQIIESWFWLPSYARSEEVKWSEVAQSCPTLCDPTDCSLPGSSLHGILQARVLEWVATSFSRGSSLPRDRTWVSSIPGRCFNLWAAREAGPYAWTGIKIFARVCVCVINSLLIGIGSYSAINQQGQTQRQHT